MEWRKTFEQKTNWLDLCIAKIVLGAPATTATLFFQLSLAVVLSGGAFVIRLLIAPIDGGIQYLTFSLAVALSAVIGGFRAGIFAALLGICLATYFFWPPYQAITYEYSRYVTFSNIVFLIDALLINCVIEVMHRSYRKLKQTQFDLSLSAQVIKNTSEGVMVTDQFGSILSINPAFTEITGYTAEDALGQKPNILRSDHQPPEFYKALWQELKLKRFWQGDLWNRKKSGEVFLEHLSINEVRMSDTKDFRYVGIFYDVTKQRQKDNQIRHLSLHDPLTSLPNRTLIQDHLRQTLARSERTGMRTAVIFIDLNGFKTVNIEFGHAAGDVLLKQIAQRITERTQSMDMVARMGGDQFVILLEDLGQAENCTDFLKSIVQLIEAPVEINSQHISLGASVGIAFYPDDGSDATELLKHADMAMQNAKATGKSMYSYYKKGMIQEIEKRLLLEAELRQAIVANEMVLYYQPKIELATGKPVGVESLIRWRHPKRGLIPPDEFIPIAEACGLIIELGDWILHTAIRQISLWQKQGIYLKVAINVASRQLESDQLAVNIKNLLKHYAVDVQNIEIEVTESMVMNEFSKAIATLQQLQDFGVSIAMDDFGTGYSSLAYLRKLPLNVIKVDRSFVMRCETEEQDWQIVKTIVALGRILHLIVVAEGIENAQQAERLQAIGCDRGQGYFFAKPMPADQLELWFKTRI